MKTAFLILVLSCASFAQGKSDKGLIAGCHKALATISVMNLTLVESGADLGQLRNTAIHCAHAYSALLPPSDLILALDVVIHIDAEVGRRSKADIKTMDTAFRNTLHDCGKQ